MRQGTSQRCHWVHFLLTIYAGHAAYPWGQFVSPVEKTKFSLVSGYQLEIASGLGMGVCPHLSPPELHVVQTHAGPCMLTLLPPSVSLSSCELGSCWLRGSCFLGVLMFTLGKQLGVELLSHRFNLWKNSQTAPKQLW